MIKWLLKELMKNLRPKNNFELGLPFKQLSVFKFEFSDIFLFETKVQIMRVDIVSLCSETVIRRPISLKHEVRPKFFFLQKLPIFFYEKWSRRILKYWTGSG